jgi:hypothetical protein
MSHRHSEKNKPPVSDAVLDAAYCKLTLVSNLLLQIVDGDLDLSSAAIRGMYQIVDEVAESINQKKEA